PPEALPDLDAATLTSEIVSSPILEEIEEIEDAPGTRGRRAAGAGAQFEEDAGPAIDAPRPADKRRKDAAGKRTAQPVDDAAPAFKPPAGRDKPVTSPHAQPQRKNAGSCDVPASL